MTKQIEIECSLVRRKMNLLAQPDLRAITRHYQRTSPQMLGELMLANLGEHAPVPKVGEFDLLFLSVRRCKKSKFGIPADHALKALLGLGAVPVPICVLLHLWPDQLEEFSSTQGNKYPQIFVALGTVTQLPEKVVSFELSRVSEGERTSVWTLNECDHETDFSNRTLVAWQQGE